MHAEVSRGRAGPSRGCEGRPRGASPAAEDDHVLICAPLKPARVGPRRCAIGVPRGEVSSTQTTVAEKRH
jgi:hypothetical protein